MTGQILENIPKRNKVNRLVLFIVNSSENRGYFQIN